MESVNDYNFWIALFTGIAAFGAVIIGIKQIAINRAIGRTHDEVDIFAYTAVLELKDRDSGSVTLQPRIHIQNVGTRLIYIDKYDFNGSIYEENHQILPPVVRAPNSYFFVRLPTNGNDHVSLEVFYRDSDGRKWKSTIFADKDQHGWKVKTLARDSQDTLRLVARIRKKIANFISK